MGAAGAACLWPAAALVGFAYGALWGLQPAMAQDLFGPRDFGVKYSFTASAAFLGSFLFSDLLAGGLYDREQEQLGTASGCFSPVCFAAAFGYTGLSALLGVALSALLAHRVAPVY